MRFVAVLCCLFGAGGCRRAADAQGVRDSLAPVRCYDAAFATGLASQSAVELCAGVATAAPGQCFADAVDRFTELSTQQAQQLCAGTTTLLPVGCYERLSARGDLTADQSVEFCATRCGLGPAPPEASSAACLDAAMTRTELTLQSAANLCRGASSAGPVECFIAGDDLQLADFSLIQLCAELVGCQYYNASPPASY